MARPTFSEVRQALADTLAAIPNLRTTADEDATINPPTAVIMPTTGAFMRYGQTMDGSTMVYLRAIVLVSLANAKMGQDLADKYLSPEGAYSICDTVTNDITLGGVVEFADVGEAVAYGPMDWNGTLYLACHFIVTIGI
jgi:hypothetical protein